MSAPRWIKVLAALLVLVAASFVPVSTETCRVDPVSGSYRRDVTWLGIIHTTPDDHRSSLAKWIELHEGAYAPTWKPLSSHTYSLYGESLMCGASPSPAICSVIGPGGVLDMFVANADDAAIGDFVNVMRNGTDEERDAAIVNMRDRVMTTESADR